MRRPSTPYRCFALLLSCMAIGGLSACGGSTSAATKEGASSFPAAIHDSTGQVDVPTQPRRIVSLSPTATEDLFAIGAGEQVVAVDSLSTYPAQAPATSLSGFTPNTEAILGYHPDLVVVSYDANGVVASLRHAGVPTLVEPSATSLEDAYDQITDLGAATGHVDKATEVIETMRSTIARAVAGTTLPSTPLSYYHEVDTTYYSVTSSTFLGQIYSLFKLHDIADGAPNAFPQLSPERVVADDPDLIFLADTKCCAQNAATVANRQGWGQLRAVQHHGVVELDDDVASRWGPRVVELVTAISDGITRTQQAR